MNGSPQKYPAWREIVEVFRAMEWGELITHKDLAEMVHLVPESRQYYGQMAQACRVLLRDHGIVVENVQKVGYRRVEPQRFPDRGQRQLTFGDRRTQMALAIYLATPLQLLKPEQVKQVELAMRKVALHAEASRSCVRGLTHSLAPVKDRKLLKS